MERVRYEKILYCAEHVGLFCLIQYYGLISCFNIHFRTISQELLTWLSSIFAHVLRYISEPYIRNFLSDGLQILHTTHLGGLDVHFGVTVLWPTFGSVGNMA